MLIIATLIHLIDSVKMYLLISLTISYFTVVYGANYCAIFSSDSTSGTSGYMRLYISDDGSYSTYDTFIDMTKTNTSTPALLCDISKGLKFHVNIL